MSLHPGLGRLHWPSDQCCVVHSKVDHNSVPWAQFNTKFNITLDFLGQILGPPYLYTHACYREKLDGFCNGAAPRLGNTKSESNPTSCYEVSKPSRHKLFTKIDNLVHQNFSWYHTFLILFLGYWTPSSFFPSSFSFPSSSFEINCQRFLKRVHSFSSLHFFIYLLLSLLSFLFFFPPSRATWEVVVHA